MIARDRSVPLFYVRLKPPPQSGVPVAVPQTKRLRDAAAALKAARKNLQDLLAETGGGPDAIESNDDPNVRDYLMARRTLRLIEEAYAAALAEARKLAKPHAPEPSPPTPDLTDNVISFEFEEDEKKADQLTLTLRNDDLSYFDSPLFEKGTALHVGWGYAGALAPAREVVVQKVTGARTLKVIAQAKSVLMNKQTNVRTFEGKTRGEIARQLAFENGYGEAFHDIEPTAVRHAVISQAAQTDAQFLKRLADQEGFEFYVDFDGFHWHPRRFKQRPVRVLSYYLPPDVGDIVDFNVENDVTAKPGTVTVQGRDPLAKKGLTATADNASTKRDTLAPILEVIDEQTLQSTQTVKVSAAAETRTTTETSGAAVKKEADAIFRRTQQTAVELTLKLVGDPYLVAKTVVEVRGLGKRLSGKYYLSTVKHTVSGSGYEIQAKAKTDGTHAGPAKSQGTANNAAPASASAAGALTPRELVDEQTLETRTVYVDTRGRSRTGATG